jgi:hypothetical protein
VGILKNSVLPPVLQLLPFTQNSALVDDAACHGVRNGEQIVMRIMMSTMMMIMSMMRVIRLRVS